MTLLDATESVFSLEKTALAAFGSIWAYVLPTLFAAVGGGLSYKTKVDQNLIKFSWAGFVGELVSAAFIGMVVLLIARASGLGIEWAGALAGISGHMGVRSLFLLELLIIKKAEAVTGVKLDELEKGKNDENR